MGRAFLPWIYGNQSCALVYFCVGAICARANKSKPVGAVNEDKGYTHQTFLSRGEIISRKCFVNTIHHITCNLIFTAFHCSTLTGVCPLLECLKFFFHQQCHALNVARSAWIDVKILRSFAGIYQRVFLLSKMPLFKLVRMRKTGQRACSYLLYANTQILRLLQNFSLREQVRKAIVSTYHPPKAIYGTITS